MFARRTLATLSFVLLFVSVAFAEEPNLEPDTQKFIDAVVAKGGAPIYTLSPTDARAVLSGAQSGAVTKLAADVKDLEFPVGPTGKTKIRITRPEGAKDALPVIMYFHGGGWILGDKETHDRLVREIANGANAAVVFVDYERSPETQYPTAIEQGFAATKYVVEHSKELNVDGTRLAIVGDSAGGQIAAAVTMLAKERSGPAIKHQVLFYPVTDSNFETGSYNEFADGPWLTKAAMIWFWDAYLPDKEARKKATASPLQASLEQLANLPPALIITDENDVLRDEGEAYAAKLAKAGVKVTAVRYLGTIHDFVMLNGVTETPAVRSAIKLANDALREALQK